jgi:hypothetical protein
MSPGCTHRLVRLITGAIALSPIGCVSPWADACEPADLTEPLAAWRAGVTASYGGRVESPRLGETQATILPCAAAGETFTLELAPSGSATCYGNEDEVPPGTEVDCRNADHGGLRFTGSLRIGAAVVRGVEGFASLGGCSAGPGATVELRVVGFEANEGLTAEPAAATPFTAFEWSRRVTPADAATHTWEVCSLIVVPVADPD